MKDLWSRNQLYNFPPPHGLPTIHVPGHVLIVFLMKGNYYDALTVGDKVKIVLLLYVTWPPNQA